MHHILVGYTNISSVSGWGFNHFNFTSVQCTIVILTWRYFISYAIVLNMLFFDHIFRPGYICFGCKMFPLLLKKHIQERDFQSCFISFPMNLALIYWSLKLLLQLIYDIVIVCMYSLILDISCLASFFINVLTSKII